LKENDMAENDLATAKTKKRNRILMLLGAAFVLADAAFALYYFLYARYHETTDNAYVRQNIVTVTPQISGIVDEVYVNETQRVKAGERLGRLDTRDAQAAFDEACADLAQTVRRVHKGHKQTSESNAAVALAEVRLAQARSDLKRRRALRPTGAISAEEFTHARDAYRQALQNLEMARQQAMANQAVYRDENLSRNPEVALAALHVRQRYLDLQRCSIVAPVGGIVAKKAFDPGSAVAAGSVLLAIVPEEGLWVDANFKETQLRHIRIGQKVTLTADLYGGGVVFHGRVEGVSPGTGSVFSLIPAQNATGNWIKIVQRVPVRIALDPAELQAHPLLVGNSMNADVDTRDRSGALLKGVATSKPRYGGILYQNAAKEAQAVAARIIRQNL
jgi:membrane fusion protein, multidrug efflux system